MVGNCIHRQDTSMVPANIRVFVLQAYLSSVSIRNRRRKTTIEEQWDKNQAFELTSVEQETYEKYFYGSEHWNYFTSDDDLGPVILSLKQESINGRDQFR